jgi:outer membrane protein TolC
LLQQSDALNASVQVTGMETALAESKSSVMNASDYLGYLMGNTPGIQYQPILTTDPLNNNTISPVLNENRSDFKAMENAIAASDLMISASRKSYLPRLNAFGSMQWNDKALAGFGAHSWLAGLNLSWDIFRGNSTRNKISTQILETQKLREQLNEQKDQGRLELGKTIRQLQDAKQRIVRDEAALKSAEEAHRILQNRYEQGLVNSTDVVQAQSQITRLGLEKAQAVFTLRTTIAYLNFLSENNQ